MSEMMDVVEDKITRAEAKYEPRYSRFLLHAKNYVQQYNQIYLHRMEQMKGHLKERSIAKWGNSCQVLNQIIDLESEHLKGQECVLIGMTFKDLKIRGSILDNFKDGNIGGALNANAVLVSDKDTLILEDQSGRVALSGEIAKEVSTLVTGVMLAAKGTMNEFGEFNVTEWLYSFDTNEKSSDNSSSSWAPTEQSKLVLLVSGLSVGSTGANDVHDLSIQLLVDFVGGRFGDEQATNLASKVVRVIVAGDSVVQPDGSVVKERFSTQKTKASVSNPSKQLDVFIAQLLNSCHVNILPGASDPANVSLPQQPFHPCLFPHSSRFNSFERVPNPCEMKVDAVVITGHSGQSVTDIARQTFKAKSNVNSAGHATSGGDLTHTCTAASSVSGSGEGNVDSVDDSNNVVTSIDNDIEETVVFDPKPQKLKPNMGDAHRRLEVLEDTLAWGHLCPTVPDTLPCYPFADVDPFIVDPNNIPSVLFAGNQPNFATKLITVSGTSKEAQTTRLICIPDFRKTGTIVLCDISNSELPCITMSFK